MWDQRYSQLDYVYGTEPNEFLKTQYHHIPQGKVLCIAEGEGRNAVFLSKQGYEVTAVDSSIEGIKKAERLASRNNQHINFIHTDLRKFDFGQSRWAGIVSIFVPLASVDRAKIHWKIMAALQPKGVFLLEAYTPKQLSYGTGGGNDVDTMQTKASLLTEMDGLDFMHLQELERSVVEGTYHTGLGSVVQAIGRLPGI